MNLKEVQKNWDKFGKTDPLWSILTDPAKKGNKWNVDEFFKTGIDEISGVMDYLKTLNIIFYTKKALDFGCGVGRLTQALAFYFDEVYGIDIAPSMIELAKKFNKYSDRCFYYVNNNNDIRQFDDNSFDFIYSYIVLQHIEPKYIKEYIKEFLRIMVPGGLLIFQLPSKCTEGSGHKTMMSRLKGFVRSSAPRFILKLYRREWDSRYLGQPIMEAYCIDKEEMIDFIHNCGAKVLDMVNDSEDSVRYCVSK